MKICIVNKTKSFLFDFSADISLLFFIYLQQWVKNNTSFLYFCGNKGTLLHTLTRKTKVSSYKRWREKYNCHVCWNVFKVVLTNGNCKLFLGHERKHKHERYTLLRLCLIKFLSAHIPLLVDYQGSERHGWGPMWLPYQSRKLYSALAIWDCLTSLGNAAWINFTSYWLRKEDKEESWKGSKVGCARALTQTLWHLRWQMSILYCLKLPPGPVAMFCQFISVRDQLV